jgi:hypothetical protein
MRKTCITIAALTFAALSASAASAAGALAVGHNVSRNGVAIGLSTDFPTTKLASRDALSQCKQSNVAATTRALCKVVKTFTGQCVSIALDPKLGTPGFGWGAASTSRLAKNAALASCSASAGPTRQGACRVVGTACDPPVK